MRLQQTNDVDCSGNVSISDYAGYVKKAISLLWCFRHMSRVQLTTQLEHKPEPEIVGDDKEDADEERIGI